MPKGYEDLKGVKKDSLGGQKRPPCTFAWPKLACTCEC